MHNGVTPLSIRRCTHKSNCSQNMTNRICFPRMKHKIFGSKAQKGLATDIHDHWTKSKIINKENKITIQGSNNYARCSGHDAICTVKLSQEGVLLFPTHHKFKKNELWQVRIRISQKEPPPCQYPPNPD